MRARFFAKRSFFLRGYRIGEAHPDLIRIHGLAGISYRKIKRSFGYLTFLGRNFKFSHPSGRPAHNRTVFLASSLCSPTPPSNPVEQRSAMHVRDRSSMAPHHNHRHPRRQRSNAGECHTCTYVAHTRAVWLAGREVWVGVPGICVVCGGRRGRGGALLYSCLPAWYGMVWYMV